MKRLETFAVAAAVALAHVACVQAPQTSIVVPERTAGSSQASSVSSAHQRDAVSLRRGSDASAASLNERWVSDLVGMKVETPAGMYLGTVNNVIVDGYGRATYAIVSYGGMMGLGNHYTAVPWVTVAEMLDRDKLLMDQAQLENAPLLPGRKPDSGNRTWGREADSYWRGKVALGAGSATVPAAPDARAPVSLSEPQPKQRN